MQSLRSDGEDRIHRPTAVEVPNSAGPSSVQIVNFACAPVQSTVTWGTTVTWLNADPTIHTVSADNNAFDSGRFGENTFFQYTANAPGTYTYFRRIHPFMKATLVVSP